MGVYWFFFIVLFISYNLLHPMINKSKLRIWNFGAGFFVFLLFAIRDISMGLNDVQSSYIPTFHYLGTVSFKTIFEKYSSDWLFYIVSKVVRMLTENNNVWLAIMSLPICIAIEKLIRRYSKIPWLSWVLFFSLGFFSVNITIMRQSVAMAFFILMVLCLEEGEIKKALIYAILSPLFHLTGIVVIIPIIIYYYKPELTVNKIIIYTGMSIILWRCSLTVVSMLFKHISFVRFQRYRMHIASFNMTMFLIFMFIFLFSVVMVVIYNDKKQNFNTNTSFIFLVGCSLPFYALTSTFSDLFRIGLYFSVFSIIIIPNSLIKIRKLANRFCVEMIIIVFVLAYAYNWGLIDVSPYISCF